MKRKKNKRITWAFFCSPILIFEIWKPWACVWQFFASFLCCFLPRPSHNCGRLNIFFLMFMFCAKPNMTYNTAEYLSLCRLQVPATQYYFTSFRVYGSFFPPSFHFHESFYFIRSFSIVVFLVFLYAVQTARAICTVKIATLVDLRSFSVSFFLCASFVRKKKQRNESRFPTFEQRLCVFILFSLEKQQSSSLFLVTRSHSVRRSAVFRSCTHNPERQEQINECHRL